MPRFSARKLQEPKRGIIRLSLRNVKSRGSRNCTCRLKTPATGHSSLDWKAYVFSLASELRDSISAFKSSEDHSLCQAWWMCRSAIGFQLRPDVEIKPASMTGSAETSSSQPLVPALNRSVQIFCAIRPNGRMGFVASLRDCQAASRFDSALRAPRVKATAWSAAIQRMRWNPLVHPEIASCPSSLAPQPLFVIERVCGLPAEFESCPCHSTHVTARTQLDDPQTAAPCCAKRSRALRVRQAQPRICTRRLRGSLWASEKLHARGLQRMRSHGTKAAVRCSGKRDKGAACLEFHFSTPGWTTSSGANWSPALRPVSQNFSSWALKQVGASQWPRSSA